MIYQQTACPWLVQPLTLAEADQLHLVLEGWEALCQQAATCRNEDTVLPGSRPVAK